MAKATRSQKKPLPKGLDLLPSGNVRVRVLNASGIQVNVGTFPDEKAALAALAAAQTDISRGVWIDPAVGKVTFAELAEEVRRHREESGELASRPAKENVRLLRTALLPSFGSKPINKISVHQVDVWWAKQSAHPVNVWLRLAPAPSSVWTDAEWRFWPAVPEPS